MCEAYRNEYKEGLRKFTTNIKLKASFKWNKYFTLTSNLDWRTT